jgi:hypothetical protein
VMEDVAQRVVHLLYDDFTDRATAAKSCVLVRFYLTMNYGDLDPELREFGAKLMESHQLSPETRCLTLIATCGEKSDWNSRRKSAGHQCIPLPSEHVVQTIPMIAQLIKQLGLDIGTVVNPDYSLILENEQRTYNVFHVPEAAGSAFIPAQSGFVLPHRVRSVLGFGGLLPTGNLYSVLMFTRVPVGRDVADMFRNAAMNLKLALLPFDGKPVFQTVE